MRPHRKGLSLPQFRALVLVDRQPEASLSEIAEQCTASLPTTSRLIAGLVAKGLVTRKGCSDDRRQLELAITRHGRGVLDAAWMGVLQHMEEELDPFTDPERKVIYDAMKLLQKKFGTLELPDRKNSRGAPIVAEMRTRQKTRPSPSVGSSKGKAVQRAAR
jgi:DNA-binding MarR family transcriptional regulator